MPEDGTLDGKSVIPTNLRLLLILEEGAKAGVPVSTSTLAAALDLPKPTMHRLLVTAEEEGFIQRDVDGRNYAPGRRLRQLSANTLSSQRLRTERLIIMKKLAEELIASKRCESATMPSMSAETRHCGSPPAPISGRMRQ